MDTRRRAAGIGPFALAVVLALAALASPHAAQAQATANPDAADTFRNQTASIDVLANDTGFGDLDILSFSGTSPSGGDVDCTLPNGPCTLDPATGFVGQYTFFYNIVDGLGDQSVGTVTVTVTNRAPVADNETATTTEGQPVVVNVLAGDTDPDNDPLVISDWDALSNKGVSVQCNVPAAGQCRYNSVLGVTGSDSFTYTVSDGIDTDVGTVTLTVNPANRPPNAVANSDSTFDNQPLTINVLNNDSDPDGDPLTLTSHTPFSPGSLGSVTCQSNGNCTFTPSGSSGTGSFTYTISDGRGGTDTATVTIKVKPSNHPPVAAQDEATTTPETPVDIDVLNNDSDPDPGDKAKLTIVKVQNQVNGAANCTLMQSKLCRFTPDPGFHGGDGSFSYVARDDDGAESNRVTVTIHVPNTQPVAVNDATTTTKNSPRTIDVLVNDTDPDGDVLSVTSAGPAPNGTVTVNGDNTVTYLPNANFTGADSFSYTISDGLDGTATARVDVTVSDTPQPDNRPPNAVNDQATTARDRAVTINVLSNDTDPDGDLLVLTGVSEPLHGSAAIANRAITYTPDPGFVGVDTFTYAISDGRGGTDEASVTVNVIATNQPPNAVIDAPTRAVTIAPGQTVTFAGTGADSDGSIAAFEWSFPGGSPASSTQEDPGAVTFAEVGDYTVVFNVVDNGGASDATPAQVTIHVQEGGGGISVLDVDSGSPGSAGRVDGHDVLFVLRAIATQDPSADVNADGHVDMADVNLVVAGLGDGE
ncbi:MAG TPA: Ig-like domain-containing protein [Gemmatimonadota bacterium]